MNTCWSLHERPLIPGLSWGWKRSWGKIQIFGGTRRTPWVTPGAKISNSQLWKSHVLGAKELCALWTLWWCVTTQESSPASSSYRWGIGGSEKGKGLPKVTQHVGPTSPHPPMHLHLYDWCLSFIKTEPPLPLPQFFAGPRWDKWFTYSAKFGVLFFPFFSFWPQHAAAWCGISVSRPGTEPGPQRWKHKILTT